MKPSTDDPQKKKERKRSSLHMAHGKTRTMLKTLDGVKTRRVSMGSGVFLAAVLETFVCALFEDALEIVHSKGRKRITPADVMNAIRVNPELKRATAGVCAVNGMKVSGLSELLKGKPSPSVADAQ